VKSRTLSEEQITSFVENGFLHLRGCIPKSTIEDIVAKTFGPNGSLKASYAKRADGSMYDLELKDCDLADTSTWPGQRVDISTGQLMALPKMAPKLWEAIESLIGSNQSLSSTKFGAQWILNTSTNDFLSDAVSYHCWHIDSPSKVTELKMRFDALTLLILWSDIEPNGGGTLYSANGVEALLDYLERSPEGATTQDHSKTTLKPNEPHLEARGQAGDVIILHGLSPHSAQVNCHPRVRILENLSLYVTRPLNYDPCNPAPSPVESCVIQKLKDRPRLATRLRDYSQRQLELKKSAEYLIDTHPNYFLPDLRNWTSSASQDDQVRIATIDHCIIEDWAIKEAAQSASRQLELIRAIKHIIERVKSKVLMLDRIGLDSRDDSPSRAGFSQNALSRMLRGFTNPAGLNYFVYLVLRQLTDTVHILKYQHLQADGKPQWDLIIEISGNQEEFFIESSQHEPLCWVDGRHTLLPSDLPELEKVIDNRNQEKNQLPQREALLDVLPYKFQQPKPCHPPPIPLGTNHQRERSAWQDYLAVRLDHMYDRSLNQRESYEGLLRNHRFGGLTKHMIESFIHNHP